MKLGEFVRLPRGPRLLDEFEHPRRLVSRLGEFTITLDVAMDALPTLAMLDRVAALVTEFERNHDELERLVHGDYMRACTDWGGEWMTDCNVPLDLSIDDLAEYIDPRTIVAGDDEDIPAQVYMAPNWDREHGLYFIYNGGWIKTDPLGDSEKD